MVDASADEEDVSDLMRDFLDQAAGVDFEVELEQISINGNEFTRATTLYQHAVVIPFVPAFELSFTAVQVVPRPTT